MRVPIRSFAKRLDITDRPEAELLSVYRDHGVVPKSSRDDNFNKPSEDLSTYRYVRPGNLVLNKMKTWQGSLAVSEFEGIVSPAYFVCELSDSVHPRFIHHLLRSDPLIAEYGARSKGIRPNQWDLPYDDFKVIEVDLPPLDEQRRIADFLDDQVGRIDHAIRTIDEYRLSLSQFPGIRMMNLMRRGDSDLGNKLDVVSARFSNGWRVDKLGHLLNQFTNGYVGPTRDILLDEGIPYIQSLHIKDGFIDFDRHPYYVSHEWHSSRERIHLREGDVLIVQTGAIGSIAVVPANFGVASCHALIIARPNASIVTSAYLGEYLRSPFGQAQLLSRATGALHPHLESGIKEAPVLIPPLAEQKQIVEKMAEVRSAVAELNRESLEQGKLLEERKRSLITAAVTGQLDVTAAQPLTAPWVSTGLSASLDTPAVSAGVSL